MQTNNHINSLTPNTSFLVCVWVASVSGLCLGCVCVQVVYLSRLCICPGFVSVLVVFINVKSMKYIKCDKSEYCISLEKLVMQEKF